MAKRRCEDDTWGPKHVHQIFPGGQVYKGTLLAGMRHGKGKLSNPNGCVYNGDWHCDMRHGDGVQLFADGSVYTGQFELDQRSGTGTLTYPNDDSYNGEWLANKQHGQGTFTSVGWTYEGGWQEGRLHGQGTKKWREGSYQGNFEDNKRHGRGKHTFPDGSVVSGEWGNDKPVGKCKLVQPNGAIFRGVLSGKKPYTGEQKFLDGRVLTWLRGACFEREDTDDDAPLAASSRAPRPAPCAAPRHSPADKRPAPLEIELKTKFCDSISCLKPHVYIIKQDRACLFKIGFSQTSVQSRLKTLQTGNPNPLKIVAMFHGAQPVEQALHRLYKDHRRKGEWFAFSAGDCHLLS